MSLPYPMIPALCQSLGFAAKLISGQGALGPTRIITLEMASPAASIINSPEKQYDDREGAYFRQHVKSRRHFSDKVLYS